MNDLTRTRPSPTARESHLRADARVVLVATGLAAAVWAASRIAGIRPAVAQGDDAREVTIWAVVVTASVVAAAAAGLLHLLERRTTSALRVWTAIAVTLWGLSLLGPLTATALSGGIVLATTHLLVGGAIVVGLRSSRVA